MNDCKICLGSCVCETNETSVSGNTDSDALTVTISGGKNEEREMMDGADFGVYQRKARFHLILGIAWALFFGVVLVATMVVGVKIARRFTSDNNGYGLVIKRPRVESGNADGAEKTDLSQEAHR